MIEEKLKQLYRVVEREEPEVRGFDPTYDDEVENLLENARRQLIALRRKKLALERLR